MNLKTKISMFLILVIAIILGFYAFASSYKLSMYQLPELISLPLGIMAIIGVLFFNPKKEAVPHSFEDLFGDNQEEWMRELFEKTRKKRI